MCKDTFAPLSCCGSLGSVSLIRCTWAVDNDCFSSLQCRGDQQDLTYLEHSLPELAGDECLTCALVTTDPRFGCEERRSQADLMRYNNKATLANNRALYQRVQAEERELRKRRTQADAQGLNNKAVLANNRALHEILEDEEKEARERLFRQQTGLSYYIPPTHQTRHDPETGHLPESPIRATEERSWRFWTKAVSNYLSRK